MPIKTLRYARRQILNFGEYTTVTLETEGTWKLIKGEDPKVSWEKLTKGVNVRWREQAKKTIEEITALRTNPRTEETKVLMGELVNFYCKKNGDQSHFSKKRGK